MASLSETPDEGPTVIVIPVQLRSRGSLREANFRFLLDYYARRVPALIIVEQTNPDRPTPIREMTERFRPVAHYLDVPITSELVHKCRLVNAGAVHAFGELGARYVWQIDADIFINPVPVIRNLAILNSVAVPVVKPFLHFARLSAGTSRDILDQDRARIDDYDPPQPSDYSVQFETLVGPGSMVFSRHAYDVSGGMDETYSGWGWEDIDFAERLASALPVHTLPFRAVHLHHEEDRQRSESNANHYFNTHRKHLPPAEKARILAHTAFWNLLRKICVIHLAGNSTAYRFEQILASHPETTHFPDFLANAELSRMHLPDVANGVVERLAETLGTVSTHSASIVLRFPFEEAGDTLLEILVAAGFRIILLSDPDFGSSFLEENPGWIPALLRNDISREEISEPIRTGVDSCRLRRRRFLKTLSHVATSYRHGLEEIAVEIEVDRYFRDPGARAELSERLRLFLGWDAPWPDLPSDPFNESSDLAQASERLRSLGLA